jgi:hypothetical protein
MLQILNPFKAGQEFQKLKTKKKWIVALAVVIIPVILSTVGNSLIQQKNQDLIQQLMEKKEEGIQQPPKEDTSDKKQSDARKAPLGPVARIFKVDRGQGGGTTTALVLGAALSLTLTLVFWVSKSVIFHMSSKVLGGEKVSISSTIHLLAYTYLPFVFKGILDIGKGLTYEAPSDFKELFQPQTTDVLIHFVRNYFNIFALWALFLIVIAVREQYSLGSKKAVIAVLIPYIVIWIVQVALISSGGLGLLKGGI